MRLCFDFARIGQRHRLSRMPNLRIRTSRLARRWQSHSYGPQQAHVRSILNQGDCK